MIVGKILRDNPNPMINNRIATHSVLAANNSELIQKVFALNQQATIIFSIFLISDEYPIRTKEISIVGMANMRLTHPNPKNQAKSFIIHKGKCNDSIRDLSLYIIINLPILTFLQFLSIFFQLDYISVFS